MSRSLSIVFVVVVLSVLCVLPQSASASLLGGAVTFSSTSAVGDVFPFAPATSAIGAGVEFTWSPAASTAGHTMAVDVDFGAEILDLVFSIDSAGLAYEGTTTLSFTDLQWGGGSNAELDDVVILEDFDLGFYVFNEFDISVTGPDSFDLVFDLFAFGIADNSPSSDTLRLGIVALAVPEPGSLALLLIGLAGVALRRR